MTVVVPPHTADRVPVKKFVGHAHTVRHRLIQVTMPIHSSGHGEQTIGIDLCWRFGQSMTEQRNPAGAYADIARKPVGCGDNVRVADHQIQGTG